MDISYLSKYDRAVFICQNLALDVLCDGSAEHDFLKVLAFAYQAVGGVFV